MAIEKYVRLSNGRYISDQLICGELDNAIIQVNGHLIITDYIQQELTESLGTEKVTNGSFADTSSWTGFGTDWTLDSNAALHATGNTTALEQNISAVTGELYKLVFTVVSRSSGSIVPYIGGSLVSSSVTSAGTYTFYVVASGTGNLRFVPSSTCDSKIDDVSVKKVTQTGGFFTIKNSASTNNLPMKIIDKTVAIGENAGLKLASTNGSVVIGQNALANCATSTNSVFIGNEAGGSVYNPVGESIAIGYRAGKNISTNNTSVFIGPYAGENNNNTDGGNTCIGYKAGQNSYYDINTFIGCYAGRVITTGAGNVFIGSQSGFNSITAGSCVFIGINSGENNNLYQNVFIGRYSGRLNTGAQSVFIGDSSGYNSSASGGSVFVGWKAGYNETNSQRLYIANSDTATPLIYGEFDTPLLRVNGAFDVTGTFTAPGIIRCVEVITALVSVDSTNYIPANVKFDRIKIVITTGYTAGATMTIGWDTSTAGLVGSSDGQNIQVPGTYIIELSNVAFKNANAKLKITIAGGPATGAGKVIGFFSTPIN